MRIPLLSIFMTVLTGITTSAGLAAKSHVPFPDPAVDESAEKSSGPKTAVFAGGCFWGVEAVFERLKGVKDAVSGFSGGDKSTAHYETVSNGDTGHAESV